MPTLQIEAESLLAGEVEKDHGVRPLFLHQGKSRRCNPYRSLITHAITVIITLLGVAILNYFDIIPFETLRSIKPRPLVWSPFTPVVEKIVEKPPKDYWENALYFGTPSDDSERAWNEMLTPHGIQIYPDEEHHFDESQLDTVKHNNGNYLLIPGVYHNLHCMRKFRQVYIYPDHYYPNMTEEERRHERDHTIHCLETIRTSMLCHPDLTLMRYYWTGRKWHDRNVGPDSTRECVNWRKIHEFKKARAYDPSLVMHDGITQGEYAANYY